MRAGDKQPLTFMSPDMGAAFLGACRSPEDIQNAIRFLQAAFIEQIGNNDALYDEARLDTLVEAGDVISKTQDDINFTSREILLHKRIASLTSLIGSLSHPEIPDFGQRYSSCSQDAGTIKIKRKWKGTCNIAEYQAYQFSGQERGFTHSIFLNPDRLDHSNRLAMAISLFHEQNHGWTTRKCPAAKFHPKNPDTTAIMHPEDFIRYIDLSERVSYVGEGLLGYLLLPHHASIRESCKKNLITLEDFEDAVAGHRTLHEAMVSCAMQALAREKILACGTTATFEQDHHRTALKIFEQGMEERVKAGYTDHIFADVSEEDFYAIGASGVGLNCLGIGSIHPEMMKPLTLLPSHEEWLAELCSKYQIPRRRQDTVFERTNYDHTVSRGVVPSIQLNPA